MIMNVHLKHIVPVIKAKKKKKKTSGELHSIRDMHWRRFIKCGIIKL